MSIVLLNAGQTTQPYPIGVGSIVSLTPSAITGATGYVEYSQNSITDINNGVATWTRWPKGSVTVTTSDTALFNQYARFICTAGMLTVQIGDPTSSTATSINPWQSNEVVYVYDTSGNLLGLGNPSGGILGGGIPAITWASRPVAASFLGAQFRFTDVGGNTGAGGGNYFYSNGVRYKAVNGEALLDAVDTANPGITGVTEQQLNPNHIVIPAAVIAGMDRLDVTCGVSKSGTTDTMVMRVRFGPLGTIADPVLATVNVAAASQSAGFSLKFKRISDTTIQLQGSANTILSYGSESGTAYAAAVTVSAMSTTPMYMSITAQMGGTTDTPTLQDYTLKLSCTDSA